MDSVVRGVLVYLILLIVMRLSGRRTLAQMTPFDFVLLLIIAETTQQALLGDDFSLSNSLVLIVTLCMTDIVLSYVKRSSPLVARVLDGVPTVLISRGEVDQRAMRRARVELEEVMEAARQQHGLARLDQVSFAVLEVGGNISIVPASSPREETPPNGSRSADGTG